MEQKFSNDKQRCASISAETMKDEGSKGRTSDTINAGNEPDNVPRLMKVVSGEIDTLPLGCTVSFYRPGKPFPVTRFNATREDQWTKMMDLGLTWNNFEKFVKKRRCVQVGNLYLSEDQLDIAHFKTIFHLSVKNDSYLLFAIIQREETEKSEEGALRGLVKLFAQTTPAQNQICNVVSGRAHYFYAMAKSWLFSFDWGVTLNTINLNCCQDHPDLTEFVSWISRHFRHVYWRDHLIPSESFFSHMLVDVDSMVEDLVVYKLLGNDQAAALAAALSQSSKIKSLSIVRLTCDASHRADIIRNICECTTLREVCLERGGQLDVNVWVGDLVSLIRCGHIQDLTYLERVGKKNAPVLPAAQSDGLKSFRTQMIINAIEANTGLARLELRYGANTDFIDEEGIRDMLRRRNDQRSISGMSRLLQTGRPLALPILGDMISRLGACDDEIRRERSTDMLFHLLLETSDTVTGLVNRSRTSAVNVDTSEKKQSSS